MPAPKKTKCRLCPAMIFQGSATGLCRKCWLDRDRLDEPSAQIEADRQENARRDELASVRARYKESSRVIEQLRQELKVVASLDEGGLETLDIKPSAGLGTSEATVVLTASDWHIEENVGAEVGGLNKFNMEIAKERASRFFSSGLRLTQLLAQDVKISNMVLPLLGDFITNDIREEFPEVNEVLPMHALVAAEGFIVSGIEFLLDHSKLKFVVPCHSGNHARTTKTTRFSSENGHSLEYLMYLHLAARFKTEPRVKFVIPEGIHSYVKVYDTMIRFHHGHAIKYQGGVGGIFIPTYKAIAQWNKARHADLDVFGHFHQCKDGGNFLCNGSLIGYNAFAISIKADFEPPKQQLFLVDKARGRTCTWPILVGREGR